MPTKHFPSNDDLANQRRLIALASEALEDFATTIGARLGQLLWQGPAADRFRDAATGQQGAAEDAVANLTTLVNLLGLFDQEVAALRAAIAQAEVAVIEVLARGVTIPHAVAASLHLQPGELPHIGSSNWLVLARALRVGPTA